MWEINSNGQAFSALLAIGLGVFLCLGYDLFRAARDYKRPQNAVVFVMDIFVCCLYAIVVFCFLQLYSNGQPRFYIFVFLGVGFLFCRLTVSYYVTKFAKQFARKISKISRQLKLVLINGVLIVEKTLKNILKMLSKWLKMSKKTLEKQ